MVPLLLLPLLWGGSLQQEQPGYELRVQELVRVQKGLSVHVPCYFSYPRSLWFSSGSLYTYWYRDGDHPAIDDPVARSNRIGTMKRGFWNRFLLADPNTNDCSLSIRDARTSDSGTYFFRVERENDVKYSYKKKMLKLQVTDKPDIHFLEPLESGQRTQVTCSLPETCQKGRRLIFFWVGDALASLNPQTLHSSVLTFTPRPQDHGTNLTCQVKCTGSSVITQRTIWLNVFYAPRNLTIGISFRNVTVLKSVQNASSLLILKGEAVRLLCLADSNPPAELTWFRGSPALNDTPTPISSTATLELPRMGTAEEGEFTCRAQHLLGSQTLSLSLSVGWKSVSQAGVVPAALGGAGVMALLSLCLCLLFLYIVRAHRKPAAGRPQVRDDEDPVVGTATWGSKQKSNTERPPDQASLAGDAPPSWEQQEIQYANLSFHRMKPQESHDQEATSSPVYSEIKRRSK
ncbi:sialic acid-binding Ig-like lectin 5 isoform X3 [Saccopteryx bilineata]|uniref:sialic acid-binding Ig-like lectin 5 isoform X3 n=1 Tax=Saccopteryx bilineata TaxID=59482 RepID=UPI00338EFD06